MGEEILVATRGLHFGHIASAASMYDGVWFNQTRRLDPVRIPPETSGLRKQRGKRFLGRCALTLRMTRVYNPIHMARPRSPIRANTARYVTFTSRLIDLRLRSML